MCSAKVSEELSTGYILQEHVKESIIMVCPRPEWGGEGEGRERGG